jgi:hypothetical protein
MTHRIRQTMYHPVFTTQTGSFQPGRGTEFPKRGKSAAIFSFWDRGYTGLRTISLALRFINKKLCIQKKS